MTQPEPSLTNPAGAGPTPLGYQYCPRCGFPRYQSDRYCGGCDLPLPPIPAGSSPFAARRPGIHDPQKKCWNCPEVVAADRSYCTICGADLRTTSVVVPKPKKPVREPTPLSMSLTVLAAVLAFLGLLYWDYTVHRSTSNHIAIIAIAVLTMVGMVVSLVAPFRRKPRR